MLRQKMNHPTLGHGRQIAKGCELGCVTRQKYFVIRRQIKGTVEVICLAGCGCYPENLMSRQHRVKYTRFLRHISSSFLKERSRSHKTLSFLSVTAFFPCQRIYMWKCLSLKIRGPKRRTFWIWQNLKLSRETRRSSCTRLTVPGTLSANWL